jgi:hypothetical protein
MTYFEARKGRFAFFTDLVWADVRLWHLADLANERRLGPLLTQSGHFPRPGGYST